MIEFAGRTAVVTGAASGIGAALARHAADLGMVVAACDRDMAGLERLAASLPDSVAPHLIRAVDITDEAGLRAFANSVSDLPPVVLLFANAGILRGGPMLSMPLADLRLLLDVNVAGTLATVQAFAPAIVAHGAPARIIVTGSTASMLPVPDLGAYCATKHALWPLVEMLGEELRSTAVGASLLLPGAVSTAIFSAYDPGHVPAADSISAETLAAMAFAGALADRAKILTHPTNKSRIADRFRAVLDQLAAI